MVRRSKNIPYSNAVTLQFIQPEGAAVATYQLAVLHGDSTDSPFTLHIYIPVSSARARPFSSPEKQASKREKTKKNISQARERGNEK